MAPIDHNVRIFKNFEILKCYPCDLEFDVDQTKFLIHEEFSSIFRNLSMIIF